MKNKASSSESIFIQADQHRERLKSSFNDSSFKTKSAFEVFENRFCFTVSEVAYALGISQKSVERLVKRGEIRVKRVGKRVLIPKSDIEAWLNQKE